MGPKRPGAVLQKREKDDAGGYPDHPCLSGGVAQEAVRGNHGAADDIAQDGRFLMVKTPVVPQAPEDQLTVIVNSLDELRRRVPLEK